MIKNVNLRNPIVKPMMEKVNYIHKWILGIYPLDFHNGFYINHDGFYINHDGFINYMNGFSRNLPLYKSNTSIVVDMFIHIV